MADTYTPEGGGWLVTHTCGWFAWHMLRPDAERAIHGHKQKCKADTTAT